MTSDRSQAYGRVIKTLEDIGPAKLHVSEQQVIRDAADTLFFSEDMHADGGAREALDSAIALMARLVEAGRLLDDTANRLRLDLESCGPTTAVS